MRPTLIILSLALILATASEFSVAFLSDTHIGDSQGERGLNKTLKTIQFINENIHKYNISVVFHKGDVTDSALPEQYRQIYAAMKQLKVRWFPLIGTNGRIHSDE
jgi:predicted MPP superfamily phosphohydrolase